MLKRTVSGQLTFRILIGNKDFEQSEMPPATSREFLIIVGFSGRLEVCRAASWKGIQHHISV